MNIFQEGSFERPEKIKGNSENIWNEKLATEMRR